MNDDNSCIDGGPAFPTIEWGRTQAGEVTQYTHGGMSHRDYLAAHAPQSVCEDIIGDTVQSTAKFIGIEAKEYDHSVHYAAAYAKATYVYADRMVAAKKTTNLPLAGKGSAK